MLITEAQKARYRAFWDRTPTDRACLFMTGWDGAPGKAGPKDPQQQWGDQDWREEDTLYSIRHNRYFAEGFPTVFTNYGPGALAACVGGTYAFAPATVWFENQPFFVQDWSETPVLNKDSEMYRMIEETTRRNLAHKDEFFTSIMDIGGTFDIIAALRGTQNLLYDMYDQPDEIKAFLKKLQPLWKEYFLTYANRLLAEQGAMTSWQPIWSDTPYYPLQCDYCAMLSPKMFDEFILPDLKLQTEYMDRSIYHLDGPGEVPHVDSLLSLPRLNAIQWTSGDGNAEITDPCWFDLYRRIQAAGKGIILLGADPNKLEPLFKAIDQRGLFLSMGVADEKQANEVIKMAAAYQSEKHA